SKNEIIQIDGWKSLLKYHVVYVNGWKNCERELKNSMATTIVDGLVKSRNSGITDRFYNE
ncbi:hypothetical protein, partial [Desulfobacula sp.]|uniref:hypothetical protein n=1 Tax=Desulfobacula sp. TaxID=2593537 RepID=UPI0039B88C41